MILRLILVHIVIILNRDCDLVQVVDALRSARSLARSLNGRQQQRHQYANNGDHDQQLDERKTIAALLGNAVCHIRRNSPAPSANCLRARFHCVAPHAVERLALRRSHATVGLNVGAHTTSLLSSTRYGSDCYRCADWPGFRRRTIKDKNVTTTVSAIPDGSGTAASWKASR